jgi:outer membrane protein assembly factor BamB
MRHSLIAVAVGLCLSGAAAQAAGWPTKCHDARRTCQSEATGPSSPRRVARFTATQGQAINMPATVGADGRVYFGTWGVVRSFGSSQPTAWDKFDGKVYAVRPNATAAWSQPFRGRHVPYCAAFPGRSPSGCPPGTFPNWANGTVEGTAAFNANQNVLYVGRGDGRLYAIQAANGAEQWSFATFNPEAPGDPDGGGEIVGGPVVGPDGTVYFATVAAGPYESNAVYAVTNRGRLKWRYPHDRKGADTIFLAAPALSPDGKTLYVGGGWGPTAEDLIGSPVKGTVLAFDITGPTGTGDERLQWEFRPAHEAEPGRTTVHVTDLAVGADGTIYAGGSSPVPGFTAVLLALRDLGAGAEYAWPRAVDLDRGRAAAVFGLALREINGVTTRVYATSGNGYSIPYRRGGKLYALDPRTGAPLWPAPFDPERYGGRGSMTGVALDAKGTIYTGVSGETSGGRVFAVREDGRLLWQFQLTGLLEWAQPVLGPEGNLYVADTRRCLFNALPIESGACVFVIPDPKLYVIRR